MDESKTAPEPPSAADRQLLLYHFDALKAQRQALLAELEEERQDEIYETLRPRKFKGTERDRNRRVVHAFLANFEDYIHHAKLNDAEKIMVLKSYLDAPAMDRSSCTTDSRRTKPQSDG
jgi:hypothetical protein